MAPDHPERRQRARWRGIAFGSATLGAFAAKVLLMIATGFDSTAMSLLIVLLAGLTMREVAWVRGYDAGRQEKTDG